MGLLETRSLTVGYSVSGVDRVLFDNLNLKLHEGRLVCFMGPNGSGKSTLIRTLSRLQRPLSGDVRVLGNSDYSTSRTISIVLTDKITAGTMTAYDVISYGRYPYLNWHAGLGKEDHKKIKEAIEAIHVQELAGKRIDELSDGQLQMVMIARALAQDTPIIILDEPTSHLDLNNRIEMMRVLKKVTREMGKAVLMATHELDLAMQTADEIWLAGSEKKIIQGIPEDLVLSGIFDEIFKFKGYDLRSGRVTHEQFKSTIITLTGDGSDFLWTRNALERSGFYVSSEASDTDPVTVKILYEESKPRWALTIKNQLFKLGSIAALIETIQSNDCE